MIFGNSNIFVSSFAVYVYVSNFIRWAVGCYIIYLSYFVHVLVEELIKEINKIKKMNSAKNRCVIVTKWR